MSEPKKIKAIIFDLNGIFLQAPKLGERLAKDYGIDHEKFMPKLHEIMHKIRQPGARPAWIYWKEFLESQKLNFTESEFWAYWFGAEKVSDQMFAFTKELRAKGIKVFILSNNFRERAFHHKRFNFIEDSFDKVYYSWQTGYIKPDVRAWQNVLNENNLTPEECIYFDDQEKNIEAAEKAGIKAFKFTTEDEFEKIVNEYK